jgi:hypothetical protein
VAGLVGPPRTRAAVLVALVVALLGAGGLLGAGAGALLPASAVAAGTSSVAKAGSTIPATQLPGSTSPFSPGVPLSSSGATQTATTPAVVTTSTTSTGGGISGSESIIIAIVALALLVGIGFFIWADSRRRAPARPGDMDDPFANRRSGSKAPPKSRKLSQAERRRRKRGKVTKRR